MVPLRKSGLLAPKRKRTGVSLSFGLADDDSEDLIVVGPDGQPKRTPLRDKDR